MSKNKVLKMVSVGLAIANAIIGMVVSTMDTEEAVTKVLKGKGVR